MNKLLFQIAKIRSMFNHQQSIIFFHLIDLNANKFQHWQPTRIKGKATFLLCLIIAQNINLHICQNGLVKKMFLSHIAITRSHCANIFDMHTAQSMAKWFCNHYVMVDDIKHFLQNLHQTKYVHRIHTYMFTVNKISH